MDIIKYWFRRFFFSNKMISLSNQFSRFQYQYGCRVQIYDEDSFLFYKSTCLLHNIDNKISILHINLKRLRYYIKWRTEVEDSNN